MARVHVARVLSDPTGCGGWLHTKVEHGQIIVIPQRGANDIIIALIIDVVPRECTCVRVCTKPQISQSTHVHGHGQRGQLYREVIG